MDPLVSLRRIGSRDPTPRAPPRAGEGEPDAGVRRNFLENERLGIVRDGAVARGRCAQERSSQKKDLREHGTSVLETVTKALGPRTRDPAFPNNRNRSIHVLALPIQYADVGDVDEISRILRGHCSERDPSILDRGNRLFTSILLV